MRTAVISSPRQAEVKHVDLPPLSPGEIRVRVQGCGVCGSNIPVWEGRPWFRYPLESGAPGHEGWGIVDEISTDVRGFHRGDRVAFLSSHAYADCDVTPAKQATILPNAVKHMPFPAEALGCAMNVFKRSGIREGDRVAIIGIGFLGAVLTQLARNAGANVAAISRRSFALQVAENYGAEKMWHFQDAKTRDAAMTWTENRGFDCVIEAVGLQESLDLAAELTKERGRLLIAWYHQDGLRQVNMQLWNWKGLDVINAHERDPEIYVQGMRASIEAVASGALDPSPLYTHTFPLEDLSQALEMARTRPDGFLKALVVP